MMTCFYYSHSTGNPFLSLLIDDVTQLCLLRLKKSILNLKESVRHKHEDSKVDYSIGECCFDRLTRTTDCRAGLRQWGLQEGSMLHRASFHFTLGQYELENLG